MNKNKIAPQFEDLYRLENTELRIRRSRIGCFLVLITVPWGISQDLLLYPSLLKEFLLIRAVEMFFVGVVCWLHYTKVGQKHAIALGLSWALSVNIYLSLMIFLADGSLSPYYAALNLVVLCAAVLLPWTFYETLFVSLFTIIIYITACYLNQVVYKTPNGNSMIATHVFFIFLTGVISVTSSYFTTQARIRDFNLRTELDARNKELEDLDRLKSQFFANISHELRTPLTLILSPIQDLLQKPELLNDKVSGLMRTARDNSLRLLKLVNDVLEVVKLEEGKTELTLQNIDLNRFLKGIVDSMSHMAEPSQIDFRKELSADSIIVQADVYALERIFLNLLSNALKFTPEGGSVTIRSKTNEKSAIIEIVDTGVGIDEKDLPYIFDRFRQADGSSTRKYQGTGLGLALVKDLTEKMDGAIAAESEPGVGTIMRVSLPVREEMLTSDSPEARSNEDWLENMHQAAEHRASLPIESPFGNLEAELPAGDKPSLLIVDDEPDMRKYLEGILESDYRLALARDGLQGLELARKLHPDLMVLDLMLPELDGLEVCKQLKEDPSTRDIKIILLTARIDETAKITALKNGADDFLTKPFSRTEVETRLGNLFETAKLEADLVQRNEELENTLGELKQTQSSLVQSEKLNALGTLSAGLLHEVNNPLNYVITALQLIKKEPEVEQSDDLQDYFSDIDEGVERIKNIVSDLHTFAHPSAVDVKKSFSLNAAVDSAMRFTAQDCKGIDVSKSLDSNDTLLGSQGHIIQVLVNLLSNAARAVKALNVERPKKIDIRSESRNGRVFVSVEDNGIGMTEEIMQRVFEPFFTTQDVGGGMGLGLSICHTITQNHGGSITVQSELGQWTRFTFDIPLATQTSIETISEQFAMEVDGKN